MSVKDTTYGTVAGIQVRVGWMVSSRTFSGSTTPNTTQVEGILDQIASEIHAKLAEAGYPISTKAVVTAAAPRAADWLEQLNEDGASALLLMTNPVAGDPEEDKDPSGYWKSRYKEGLKMIKGTFLSFLGLSRDREMSDHLVSGSYKNTDGEKKLPIFTRNVFDYPSSRTLTEG